MLTDDDFFARVIWRFSNVDLGNYFNRLILPVLLPWIEQD